MKRIHHFNLDSRQFRNSLGIPALQEPCRFLDIRTNMGLDVCEYPDSGKINILPFQEVYKNADRVDYYQGEDKVSEKWAFEMGKKKSKREGVRFEYFF